jgi:hypothetical protein
MTTPTESDRESGKLSRFFSNHPLVGAIGVVGSLASVFSVPLAIYLFFESYKARELTYYVHPVRAIVATTGTASQLSVNYAGKEIITDVTAVQVALWNRGRETIRTADILKPLIIQTEGGTPILEATIRMETRDVVGLRKVDESELDRGRLAVSWDILEENDGGVVQLIVAGKPDVKITAAAVIEGQRNIEEETFSGNIRSVHEQYSDARREQQRYALFTLMNGVLLGLLTWLNLGLYGQELRQRESRKELAERLDLIEKLLDPTIAQESQIAESRRDLAPPERYPSRRHRILLILLQACSSLIFIGMGLYGLLFQRSPTPPFDF